MAISIGSANNISADEMARLIEQQARAKNTSDFIKNRENSSSSASEDHVLIVNGKVKPIGKKSQYLLDMLTLDDE